MPFDLFEDAERLSGRFRIVVFSQVPETMLTILVHESMNLLHDCRDISVHIELL
jgi:hypothetical protein